MVPLKSSFSSEIKAIFQGILGLARIALVLSLLGPSGFLPAPACAQTLTTGESQASTTEVSTTRVRPTQVQTTKLESLPARAQTTPAARRAVAKQLVAQQSASQQSAAQQSAAQQSAAQQSAAQRSAAQQSTAKQSSADQSAADQSTADQSAPGPALSHAEESALPLHGLSGGTSLGVYPTLDKSLLITPGAHPVKVAVPLSQIVAGGQLITGKVEHPDKSRGKYQALYVSVTNNADRPLLFDGDAAVANTGSTPLACVPLTKLEELSVLPEQSKNFGTKFKTDLVATTTAAVTLGWYQTLRDQKRASGPVTAENGGRYSLDEQRREDQLRRFGKRVLWPGDATSGVIYFDTGRSLSAATIDLPVSSYYEPKDQSTVVLH